MSLHFKLDNEWIKELKAEYDRLTSGWSNEATCTVYFFTTSTVQYSFWYLVDHTIPDRQITPEKLVPIMQEFYAESGKYRGHALRYYPDLAEEWDTINWLEIAQRIAPYEGIIGEKGWR